jgi:hypothetical protein
VAGNQVAELALLGLEQRIKAMGAAPGHLVIAVAVVAVALGRWEVVVLQQMEALAYLLQLLELALHEQLVAKAMMRQPEVPTLAMVAVAALLQLRQQGLLAAPASSS